MHSSVQQGIILRYYGPSRSTLVIFDRVRGRMNVMLKQARKMPGLMHGGVCHLPA